MKMNNNGNLSQSSPLASVPAACRYLGDISRAGLYNLKDQLEWVKIGGRSFITIASMDALIRAGSQPSAARANSTVEG